MKFTVAFLTFVWVALSAPRWVPVVMEVLR